MATIQEALAAAAAAAAGDGATAPTIQVADTTNLTANSSSGCLA